MQILKIEQGVNPPEVTGTAMVLIHKFAEVNKNQQNPLFLSLAAMTLHFIDPQQFPLETTLKDSGLAGIVSELAEFFEGNKLTATTIKAFELIEKGGVTSDLAYFLAFLKEKI